MRYLLPALALTLSVSAAAQTVEPLVVTAPAPATAPADPDQEIRCRRMAVTGSLARRERVCKTVGEWRRLGERGNDNARDIIDASRGRPSGQ